MGLNNQNNQSVNIPIPQTQTVKDIPYTQNNEIMSNPTPGVLCFGAFLIILIILYKKIEQHYLNYFEHKKEMDKLELDLKYGKGKII
jgi:hypothetical protein